MTFFAGIIEIDKSSIVLFNERSGGPAKTIPVAFLFLDTSLLQNPLIEPHNGKFCLAVFIYGSSMNSLNNSGHLNYSTSDEQKQIVGASLCLSQ